MLESNSVLSQVGEDECPEWTTVVSKSRTKRVDISAVNHSPSVYGQSVGLDTDVDTAPAHSSLEFGQRHKKTTQVWLETKFTVYSRNVESASKKVSSRFYYWGFNDVIKRCLDIYCCLVIFLHL